jgi:hypothetical protein
LGKGRRYQPVPAKTARQARPCLAWYDGLTDYDQQAAQPYSPWAAKHRKRSAQTLAFWPSLPPDL